ncbi:hypothetical protein J3R82DRAFT_8945 [Butyriboletus roseoflavus]|nr:hypothetical protein J3R82DRAFT_8945 [Butyriboletus roseoflavus]
MEDLDTAIVLNQDALVLCPSRAPTLINNLTIHLSTWYNQLGVMEDLNEAIGLDQDALVLCLPEARASSLIRLFEQSYNPSFHSSLSTSNRTSKSHCSQLQCIGALPAKESRIDQTQSRIII